MRVQLPLHVEIVQKRSSRVNKNFIIQIVQSYLANFATILPGTTLSKQLEDAPDVAEHVQCISFCDAEQEAELSANECEFIFHVCRLDATGAEADSVADASGDEITAATVWALPHEDFHGLWDSLVYDSRLKQDALRFAETAFEFGDCGIDPNVVGVNRVLLFHGPTGTGKTSLCRALAHKLAVRLDGRFPRARLLEIDAHSLFSKWFSESGKLVARLFERVSELAQDPRLLVCVLVDEVESLAAARHAALRGLEPSDAVRAVNAVLTQLDRLRRLPNALVLTTSNVTGAIDVAFVDRADLKRLVGPPSARAAYVILRSCCAELQARGVVSAGGESLLDVRALTAAGPLALKAEGLRLSRRLWAVADAAAAAGLSGRALRRLPFLARALHTAPRPPPELARFVEALHEALGGHVADCGDLRAAATMHTDAQHACDTSFND